MKKLVIMFVCVCAVCAAAIAQEKKADGFKNALNAGVTLTDGNSKTLQANAAIVTEGDKEGLGSVRAGIEANYGDSTIASTSNRETTVENVSAFASAKKTITPRTFGSLNGDVMYDNIADIDYRATIGPGLGVYLVKDEQISLSVEAGVSYIWEKVAAVSDDYLAVRFAERLTYAISATAKAWQSLEYLPKADNFGDCLMSAELGAEAAMNSRFSLRVLLQDKYDSMPAEGFKKNDLTLISGVTVSL